jgi:DNA-binding transcriptional MerR regulator
MAPTAQIPKKASYRLHEVCKHADIQPYVLRFWESEFPQLRPNRSRAGQPVYTRKDIELVLRIKRMLDDDAYTLDAAREELDLPARGKKAGRRGKAAPAGPPNSAAGSAGGSSPRAKKGIAGSSRKAEAVVRKQRYDDAVEEIASLRLLLKDVEAKLRQAEQELEEARNSETRQRERCQAAAGHLESLLERLS